MNPQLLKLLAAICFGASAMLLGIVVWYLLRSETVDTRNYTGPSMRRAHTRRRALQNSPLFGLLLVILRSPTRMVSRMDIGGLRSYLAVPYARAGYPGGLDDNELVALGLVLSLFLTVFFAFSAAVFWGIGTIWLGLIGLPMGFLAVVSSLKTRADHRLRQILTAMPYVLDLIVLILRSGTSLNIAIQRVVADYLDHPVGDELGQVLAEIEMGAPRSEAMRRMAQRLDSQDITGLADSIVQSEELGWPLADTLQRQSDRMVSERILRAQSTAGAAGVIVMLPSTLVLVAAVLLLLAPMILWFFAEGTPLK